MGRMRVLNIHQKELQMMCIVPWQVWEVEGLGLTGYYHQCTVYRTD